MKKNNIQKLVICAVLIALHIVLEYVSIRIGNDYKITLSGLPFIIAAVIYGPLTGLGVGLLATFLSQLLTFGITVTTPFWVIPGAVHGLMMGIFYMLFCKGSSKKKESYEKVTPFVVSVFASGFITSFCNLCATYFDSKIFHYYKPGYIIALLPIRLANWALTAVVCSILGMLILRALYKVMPQLKN